MTVELLAIGAHPDDVELGCGGTLATLALAGRRVGILHLTRGEMGTRGSADERMREAEAAAAAIGAVELAFLDCGDGGLRTGPAEVDALVAELRRLRPEIVLGPAPRDRHPDHGRAHRLVADACFYAGLRRRGQGSPHRPGARFSYFQHDLLTPSFVVDVTTGWARKVAALDCYESQLHQGGNDRGGPMTKVASREFRLAVEGRARTYGLLVGAELGEPFHTDTPLAIGDPMTLVPGGIR